MFSPTTWPPGELQPVTRSAARRQIPEGRRYTSSRRTIISAENRRTLKKTERRPEILAPAGTAEAMKSAVENGADAIYFGLERWNARERAANFKLDELPSIMAELHRRGVKGYVT